MPTFKLDHCTVGDGQPCFVIAEAGNNHQGKMEIAKKLVDAAAFSGANAVKFQKRNIESLYVAEELNRPYTGPNSFGETYGEHRRALELSKEDFIELKQYSEAKDLVFLASAWDFDSIDFLDQIGVSGFKMASADLTNLRLLTHAAKKQKPIILSTGMSSMEEVKMAYRAISQYVDKIALLQCTSTYPSSFEDLHLNVIKTYEKQFPSCVVGYSGHELGIAISAVVTVLGAHIVERHFTLDRAMRGTDHAASLEPGMLFKLVRDIRTIEKALGFPEKVIVESERPSRKKLAKSLVSLTNLPKGEVIKEEMLTMKSPGTGISPNRIEEVLGQRPKGDIMQDTILTWELLDKKIP